MQRSNSDNEPEIASQLVERIKNGDVMAENDMVERYQRGLLFMLRHRANNSELAKDIAQETWRITLEKVRAGQLKDPSKLAAFIVQIGKNQLTMSYRGAVNTRTTSMESVPEGTDDKNQPQQILERHNTALLVRKLLGELSTPRDKEIMMRFYIKEQNKHVICQELGLDDIHFNRVLYRAKERFKKLWQEFSGAD